ncbi:DUF4260 domain-containing protein [Herpetosiphon llansteffanensis]|uniref:DUF4260 domain-containing protein n=1 Tax=Herpetosiphon llansteffanensis TaxID=2094568 RepID=UPI000D7CACC9|nr:DUF4260 domain-containing protein [Herpetosiphon llansteffanensis]
MKTASLAKQLLHAEGLGLLLIAILGYAWQGFAWWQFALALFAPDLLMLGYLWGPKVGSICYNLGHVTLLPLSFLALGVVNDWRLGLQIGLIWLSHIGLDRMLGYGLKYPTQFKDTHLGRV